MYLLVYSISYFGSLSEIVDWPTFHSILIHSWNVLKSFERLLAYLLAILPVLQLRTHKLLLAKYSYSTVAWYDNLQ